MNINFKIYFQKEEKENNNNNVVILKGDLSLYNWNSLIHNNLLDCKTIIIKSCKIKGKNSG